ncbi:MAG: glycyl-radical enzyme activating protein [Clostridiales bacterium]|nr:glycyl-radical enzyme activating protein [Clostridiales bacterium]
MFKRRYRMVKGTVFNVQKFCLHDGDGVRTCVFLKGCPLGCIWCHNPESKSNKVQLLFNSSRCSLCGRCLPTCKGRSIKDGKLTIDRTKCDLCGECIEHCLNDANELCGKERESDEVFAEVMKDKMFYDSTGGGITVSGGEPSYQPEFTLELLRLAKEAGISRAIETCGIGKAEFYRQAAELGTLFLFDIKCIDPEKHKKLTKVDNAHILSNLKMLTELGAEIIIRMPMVPGCNDSDEDIALLCEFLKQIEGKYRYAEIMAYHKLGVGKSQRIGEDAEFVHENATDEDKLRWVEQFKKNGIEAQVSQ